MVNIKYQAAANASTKVVNMSTRKRRNNKEEKQTSDGDKVTNLWNIVLRILFLSSFACMADYSIFFFSFVCLCAARFYRAQKRRCVPLQMRAHVHNSVNAATRCLFAYAVCARFWALCSVCVPTSSTPLDTHRQHLVGAYRPNGAQHERNCRSRDEKRRKKRNERDDERHTLQTSNAFNVIWLLLSYRLSFVAIFFFATSTFFLSEALGRASIGWENGCILGEGSVLRKTVTKSGHRESRAKEVCLFIDAIFTKFIWWLVWVWSMRPICRAFAWR